MVGKYRKKPVVIEAIQWTGYNQEEILEFCPKCRVEWEPLIGPTLMIYTLEGTHYASINDFVIKGIRGEFYPCKPGIFEETYEPAE